jgi:hypothetical protein
VVAVAAVLVGGAEIDDCGIGQKKKEVLHNEMM